MTSDKRELFIYGALVTQFVVTSLVSAYIIYIYDYLEILNQSTNATLSTFVGVGITYLLFSLMTGFNYGLLVKSNKFEWYLFSILFVFHIIVFSEILFGIIYSLCKERKEERKLCRRSNY